MLPVIQYGWLFLLLCVGIVLFLVGCATLSSRPPTRSTLDFPLVTLTIVPFATESPLPYSTRPSVATQPTLPPPGWMATRTTSSTTKTDDPTCYNSPNHGFTCLGRVWNHTAETLSNITVRVALFEDSGKILAEQVIGLEQRYLPPETSAPYRAQFEEVPSNRNYAQTTVEQMSTVNGLHLPIRVTGERGVLATSGRYVVTANLQNTSERLAEHIRLIVTLLDAEDHVVGYRVQAAEPIAAGTERAVRMELIPQVTQEDLHHLLHVESWNND